MVVEGATIPNDSSTFDIHINDNLDDEIKQRKIGHEVHYIQSNDFYNDRSSVGEIEMSGRHQNC